MNAPFLASQSSDLGGVWAVSNALPTSFILQLSRLGCATFILHLSTPLTALLYFSFKDFEGALSAPGGRVVNAPFLASQSSDLGGVWPFRMHCRRASFL